MRDFTLAMYVAVLEGLNVGGYGFRTLADFLDKPIERVVILRHDVDKMPLYSLEFARIEHEKGIRASYYFRCVPQSFQPAIIREIASLGHEIGYHYEDLDLCKGNPGKAYRSFQGNLARLRELATVQTICMHGSPYSKHDNRKLWQKYDYRDLGIIGEPYFDLDYSKVFYLTDTGRKWNAEDASIRDKVDSHFHIKIKNTRHLIRLIQEGGLPDQIMINTHPQRWNDNVLLWGRELVWQNVKNVVKRYALRVKR
jgi:hypothetical protein